MKKRWPIIPTLIVILCVAIMVGLGIWQLQRAQWKNALLVEYQLASGQPAIAWPQPPVSDDLPLYRKSGFYCQAVTSWRQTSGRDETGRSGWLHIATCRIAGTEGPGAQFVAGWSATPAPISWPGGPVSGIIAPDSRHLVRLVTQEPVPGLSRPQPPSLDDIPNNHMAYAVQWFLFAASALVIYWLAVRRRRN